MRVHCAIDVVQHLKSWMMMQCVHSSLSKFFAYTALWQGYGPTDAAECCCRLMSCGCDATMFLVTFWRQFLSCEFAYAQSQVHHSFHTQVFQHWCQWAYNLVQTLYYTTDIIPLCTLFHSNHACNNTGNWASDSTLKNHIFANNYSIKTARRGSCRSLLSSS